MIKLNFQLCATGGTAKHFNKNGIKCKKINKINQGSPHIVDILNAKKIALIIGAGDYLGSELAKKFAVGGLSVVVTRRRGDLSKLVTSIVSLI